MTDRPALPQGKAPEKPKTAAATPLPEDEARPAPVWPIAGVIGFLLLAGAIVYVWENPRVPSEAAALRTLDTRLAAVESRPAPDLGGVETRLANLEKSTAQLADAASKTALTQLAGRIDMLSGRVDQMAARLQAGDPALRQHLDALSTRMDGVATQAQAAAAAAGRIDALETRVAALEKATGGMPALASRAALLARMQAASAALDAGEPLGRLPGAPPALARYETARPPTLAALKLAFPAAARAAEEASLPPPAQANLGTRMWDRVQGLLVVRQGDHVLVGNPAAGILARAHRDLDAGDLAGAVAAVKTLTGSAAAAMAPWLADAENLLAARQAMAALAAHA